MNTNIFTQCNDFTINSNKPRPQFSEERAQHMQSRRQEQGGFRLHLCLQPLSQQGLLLVSVCNSHRGTIFHSRHCTLDYALFSLLRAPFHFQTRLLSALGTITQRGWGKNVKIPQGHRHAIKKGKKKQTQVLYLQGMGVQNSGSHFLIKVPKKSPEKQD